MKDFIYPEMIVHVPICTHKEPNNMLVLSANTIKIQQEISRHPNIQTTNITPSLESIQATHDNSFDIIISECEYHNDFITQINRVLKNNGIFVSTHPTLNNIDKNKELMVSLAKYFKIIMPYHLEDGTTLLLASKEYHPTADIILQRADMLDGLKYYNSDIHVASFTMGNYIKKEYLGVIKN